MLTKGFLALKLLPVEGHRDGRWPPHLSRKLGQFVIPILPLLEQHRIVAKVDELMALCDQLKSRITAANRLQQKLADVVVEQAIA